MTTEHITWMVYGGIITLAVLRVHLLWRKHRNK